MNTFWLKVAAGIVGIVVIVVIIGMFTSNVSPPPEEPDKTFYDQAREDKEKFLAEPKAVESPDQQQVPEQNQVIEAKAPAEETVAETKPQQLAPKPAAPPKPKTLYFKPLSEIDQIEAERLLNVAAPGRSLGRLRTGYKLMMDTSRQIINKWPDSWYAYRAKQMIIDMPERYRERYKVTEDELDLSMFYKQRPGTKPYTD